jgi:hypothetical protein
MLRPYASLDHQQAEVELKQKWQVKQDDQDHPAKIRCSPRVEKIVVRTKQLVSFADDKVQGLQQNADRK